MNTHYSVALCITFENRPDKTKCSPSFQRTLKTWTHTSSMKETAQWKPSVHNASNPHGRRAKYELAGASFTGRSSVMQITTEPKLKKRWGTTAAQPPGRWTSAASKSTLASCKSQTEVSTSQIKNQQTNSDWRIQSLPSGLAVLRSRVLQLCGSKLRRQPGLISYAHSASTTLLKAGKQQLSSSYLVFHFLGNYLFTRLNEVM